MASYFAQVFVEPEGGYFAEFPDLPGAITQGDTMEELDVMLKDALLVYLETCKELGDDIPAPSSFEDVLAAPNESGPVHAVVLVTIPSQVKRERVNVSLLPSELAVIDAAAEKRRMNRSQFLAAAAMEQARKGESVTY